MKYTIEDLQVFAMPKAEKMFEFTGLPSVSFDYPEIIRTLLFGECIHVQMNSGSGEDYYQVVGRMYSSANPQATGEKHIGKLYVNVYGHPHATRFESRVDRLEWHSDGSFDMIEPDGTRTNFRRPDSG